MCGWIHTWIYGCPLVIGLPEVRFSCQVQSVHRRWRDHARELLQGVAVPSRKHGLTWEGASRGWERGIKRGELLWVRGKGWCQRGTLRLLKMTPEGVTQSWTLHITMSQQAAKERCEKSGEWAKRAETELDNPWWKNSLRLPLTHTYPHTLPLKTPDWSKC